MKKTKPNSRKNLFLITCLLMAAGYSGSAQLSKVVPMSNWDIIAKATGFDTLCSVWANPKAISFEVPGNNGDIVRKIIVNWQTNMDYGPYPYLHGTMSSTNEGASYGTIVTDTYCDPYLTGTDSDTNNVDLMTAIKRRDGVIIAIPYRVKYPPQGQQATKKYYFAYNISTDNGETWTHFPDDTATGGTVTFDSTVLGMRFHQGAIQENDGTIYAPVYARYLTDTVFRVVLMKSTDGGVNWTFYSKVQFTPTLDYTESGLVRCANGDWLMVMRSDSKGPGGTIQRLKQKRSTNKGVTWGPVIYTPGLDVRGVNPKLLLMPNGILVLSYGHNLGTSAGRSVRIAFSTDNGHNWIEEKETFTPVAGTLESTGYTAMAPVTAHRLIQITDQGISWSYGSKTPNPNPYAIKQKVIDIVRTQRNRIDLKRKYAIGAISVTSDFPASYSGSHPEARLSGAFDGSTDYWSGAFKSGSSGTFTIDLKEDWLLNAVGLCMHVNNAQSATVALSEDSVSWTTVKTYSNAVQQCLEYTNFNPIKARYVRVTVSGTGPVVSLNEIELYSIADSYENDAQNKVPEGYTTLPSGGFWVSEGVTPFPTGYQSRRALLMNDATDQRCEITKLTTASTSKTLQFRIRTKSFAAYAGAIQWKIVSGTTNAFRMRVTPLGSVQYYDGSSYHTISGLTIPADTWTLVTVTANASTGTGTISINGGAPKAIGKEATVSSLNGFRFSSGGGASIGDKALFDDVSFYGPDIEDLLADEPFMRLSQHSTDMPAKKALSMTVTPNPSSTLINVYIENAMDKTTELEIFNAMGQQVKRVSYTGLGKLAVRSVSIAGLAPGIYVVRLKQGVQTVRKKLVVQ